MISRRGLPLRWRAAALTASAIVLLALVSSIIAFLVVRNALQRDLQRALGGDAQTVASLYRQGAPPDGDVSLSGPTGRVMVQLYDPAGELLAASDPVLEGADARIPSQVFSGLQDQTRAWRGILAGRQVRVAVAGFGLGYVAVIADTSYITNALAQLARALLITALVLVVAAALLGFVVAGASIWPIRELARRAELRGPERLDPIDLRGPRDEVAQLADVINDLMRRLSEALDAQRSFLAETSHELRTPLTSLHGFLERARRRAGPDAQRELEDARRVAATLSRLVEDLLQLSRGQLVREMAPHLVDPWEDVVLPIAEEFPGVVTDVERGLGPRLEPRPAAGAHAVREVALAPPARGHGGSAGTAGSSKRSPAAGTVASTGTTILGDPERLRQLLRNLVANAVRASGDPGGVRVEVVPRADEVVLEVTDSGPGIPSDVLPRIFDKFYKGAGGGSGLGLAIARQIAEHHGGTIDASSRPGHTVFTVRLPTVEGEA